MKDNGTSVLRAVGCLLWYLDIWNSWSNFLSDSIQVLSNQRICPGAAGEPLEQNRKHACTGKHPTTPFEEVIKRCSWSKAFLTNLNLKSHLNHCSASQLYCTIAEICIRMQQIIKWVTSCSRNLRPRQPPKYRWTAAVPRPDGISVRC